MSALHFEVLGSGPPLLLLHGAGGTVRDNYPFVDELARSFTVVAPDLPGAGSSALPDHPLDLDTLAQGVVSGLDRHGFDVVAVCGYSLGSTLAVHLAAGYPHRARAIVLSAGFTRARPSLRASVDVWAALLGAAPQVLGSFLLGMVNQPETLDARGDDWVNRTAHEIGTTMAPGTHAHLELIRRVDTTRALASTKQPMLVVVPQHDVLVQPAHSADVLTERPDAIEVRLAAGHALGDEAPEHWLAAIVDFLSDR